MGVPESLGAGDASEDNHGADTEKNRSHKYADSDSEHSCIHNQPTTSVPADDHTAILSTQPPAENHDGDAQDYEDRNGKEGRHV